MLETQIQYVYDAPTRLLFEGLYAWYFLNISHEEIYKFDKIIITVKVAMSYHQGIQIQSSSACFQRFHQTPNSVMLDLLWPNKQKYCCITNNQTLKHDLQIFKN